MRTVLCSALTARPDCDGIDAAKLKSSLLKALVELTSQMTSLTLVESKAFVDALFQLSRITTNTPGISVVPEIIHVSYSTLFQQ